MFTHSRKVIFFIMWSWTLTSDLDFRTSLDRVKVKPACQVKRHLVKKSYWLGTQTHRYTRPIALAGPLKSTVKCGTATKLRRFFVKLLWLVIIVVNALLALSTNWLVGYSINNDLYSVMIILWLVCDNVVSTVRFSLLKFVKFSFLFSLICYWFYHSSE